MLTLDELLWALPQCWGPDTADSAPYWPGVGNPQAKGQCIVSSLVIKKHLGGDMMRATVGQQAGAPHYFNQLENGMWIDSTRSQFMTRSPVRDIKKNPDPKYWEFKDTWDRVELLERRVIECLFSTYVDPAPLQTRLTATSLLP